MTAMLNNTWIILLKITAFHLPVSIPITLMVSMWFLPASILTVIIFLWIIPISSLFGIFLSELIRSRRVIKARLFIQELLRMA